MSLRKPAGIDFYSLFSTFLITAAFGWFFETLSVFLLTGKVSGRGLLFVYDEIGAYVPAVATVPFVGDLRPFWGLPIIVVYGIGGCVIALLLKRHQENYAFVFSYGMILLTLVELCASYFCEYALSASLWNYEGEFMNFQGRICLRASLAWGVISVIAIKVLIPTGYRLYEINRRISHYKALYLALFLYVGVCIVYKYVIGR